MKSLQLFFKNDNLKYTEDELFIFTRYSLLFTCYVLLFCSLLITYSLLVTFYSLLVTCYPLNRNFQWGKKHRPKFDRDLQSSCKHPEIHISFQYMFRNDCMLRTRFRVNPHSIVARMSRNSLLKTGAKS